MVACIITVALALTTLEARQKPATFKSQTELVEVDVSVVDKDGKAVRSLAMKDFAITDRKKPQAIATFTEESHERRAAGADAMALLPATTHADVASNTAVQADRLVMLVIDDLHIYKGRADRAKDIARAIITSLGAQASMSVIFTSGEGSTQVTPDRATLLAAVDPMIGRQSVRRPHQATDNQRAGVIDSGADGVANLDTVGRSQLTNLQDFEDNMRWIRTLADVAKMLRIEDQRRKAFVMISEGVAKSMNGIFDSEMTPCEIASSACYHDRELKDMMESLRRSNVTTYSIDPRGKVRPEDMLLESSPAPTCAACQTGGSAKTDEDSQFRWDNPVRQAQDGLTLLSEASGGFAVTDTNDFTSGLDAIIQDLDHYYLLGFYPADPMGNKYRPLAVTVPGHPDWTIRYRHGYVPGSPKPDAPNKDPLMELARGVMPKSDLPLRLTALPLLGNGKTATVAVALEVTAPTGAMKDADSKLRDDVTYSILVVDDKKSKVTSRTGHAARLALSARRLDAEMPDSVTYQIPLTLDLGPGRYQLRASAMSKRLNKGGSVYFDVTVPDFTRAPLLLTSIALGYADGAHVAIGRPGVSPAQQAGGRMFGVRDAMPPAQPIRRLPFDPSLDRVFAPTDTLRAYFEVARKDQTSKVSMTIVVVDVANKSVMALERVIGPGESGRVDIRLPLGALARGAYRLRVVATDGHSVANTEAGMVVK